MEHPRAGLIVFDCGLEPDLLVFPGHDLPELDDKRRDVHIHNREYFKATTWQLENH